MELARHIQEQGVMTKFIFTPFIAVFFILAAVTMLFFLAFYKLIRLIVKALNFFLCLSGYKYRLNLDSGKVEK